MHETQQMEEGGICLYGTERAGETQRWDSPVPSQRTKQPLSFRRSCCSRGGDRPQSREASRSGARRGSVTLHHPAWAPRAPPGSAVPNGVICSSYTGRTKYLCFRGMDLLPHESCQMDSPSFTLWQQQPQPGAVPPTAAERTRASTGPPLAKAVPSPLWGAHRLGSSCGMRPSPRLPAELHFDSVTWICLVALPFSSPWEQSARAVLIGLFESLL